MHCVRLSKLEHKSVGLSQAFDRKASAVCSNRSQSVLETALMPEGAGVTSWRHHACIAHARYVALQAHVYENRPMRGMPGLAATRGLSRCLNHHKSQHPATAVNTWQEQAGICNAATACLSIPKFLSGTLSLTCQQSPSWSGNLLTVVRHGLYSYCVQLCMRMCQLSDSLHIIYSLNGPLYQAQRAQRSL